MKSRFSRGAGERLPRCVRWVCGGRGVRDCATAGAQKKQQGRQGGTPGSGAGGPSPSTPGAPTAALLPGANQGKRN